MSKEKAAQVRTEAGRKVISEDEFRAQSRRSFLVGLAFLGFGGVGLRQLANDTGENDRIPGPLRQVHDFNSVVWQALYSPCLLYTSPSPRDATLSRMPSSA